MRKGFQTLWAMLTLVAMLANPMAAQAVEPDSICPGSSAQDGADLEAQCLNYAQQPQQSPATLLKLGSTLDRQGYPSIALAVLEAANQRYPGNTKLLQAQLRARANSRDRKRLLANQSEQADQTLSTCWEARWQKALAACHKRFKRKPTAKLLARIGQLHRSLGQPRQALKAYESAIAMTQVSHPQPDNNWIQWHQQTQILRGIITASPSAVDLRPKTVQPKLKTATAVQEALIIGNNNYRHYPPLASAVKDAQAIARVLTMDYGMRVTTLMDATRQELLDVLATARARLGPEDDLLIYYAGHGYIDNATGQGYWLPIDANPQSPANWISNNDIQTAVLGLNARDVLLIADSCYAGSLLAKQRQGKKTNRTALKGRARNVLASGNIEPVLDEGPDGHSVFASILLNELRTRNPSLSAARLHAAIATAMQTQAPQEPVYGSMFTDARSENNFHFIPANR